MDYTYLLIYFIVSIYTIGYTFYTMNDNNIYTYKTQVHYHLSSIMFYHLFVVSFVLLLEPRVLSDNIYISIVNTMLSIMFSTLFYFTDKKRLVLRHIYNALYLTFASILMAEFLMYFNANNYFRNFYLVYIIFVINNIFYSKDNRQYLTIVYACICFIGMLVDNSYSTFFSSMYACVIIAFLYYDDKYLTNTTKKNHLEDALKYFLDFEGTLVRLTSSYID